MTHPSVFDITAAFLDLHDVDVWIRSSLMKSLRCTYSTPDGRRVFLKREIMDVAVRAELKLCLPKILGVRIDHENNSTFTASLLGALDWYDCLEICRASSHLSFQLARAILLYISRYQGFDMDVFARPRVLSLLNDWIRPETKWRTLPSTLELCGRMFGDAWCTLCLPDVTGASPRVQEMRFRGAVDDLRPDLLPGLCSEVLNAQELPQISIEGPS